MHVSIERGALGRPARLARYLGPIVAAVLAVTMLARFVFRDASSSAPPSAAVDVVDRIASLEARVSANRDDLGAWQQLARAYVRQAVTTGDPTHYTASRNAIDNATRLAPDDHLTLVASAALDLSLHDFVAARATAERVLAADPFNDEALAALIDAHVELGEYDAAMVAAQDLLDRKPGLAALSRASYLRELHGDPAGARAAMGRAVEAATGSSFDRAVVIALTGDLALADGDHAAAASHYERALALAPGLVAAEVGRARAMAASGDLRGAIVRLNELAQRSPLPAVTVLAGELSTLAGDERAAADAFALARASNRLVEAAGGDVELEAAVLEADHGDAARALERAQAIHAARPTIFAADAVAWSLARLGRYDEARRYSDEALRLGTRSVSLLVHAAVIRAGGGDLAGAAEALRNAFTRSPWTAPSVLPEAASLAERLSIEIPRSWRIA